MKRQCHHNAAPSSGDENRPSRQRRSLFPNPCFQWPGAVEAPNFLPKAGLSASPCPKVGSHGSWRGFNRCDRRLHEALRAMVLDRGERSVAALNKLDIWPPETRLFSDRLGFEGLAVPARAPHRRQWVERALAATRGAAVVCVDPDNGLETPSVKPHHARGPKHAFVDELQPFWQRGQSLIVYQHTHRRGTAAEQVARRLPGLRDAFQGAAAIHALRFRRGTSRVFLVIGHPEHGAAIDERIGDMLASPWGDHFERLEVG